MFAGVHCSVGVMVNKKDEVLNAAQSLVEEIPNLKENSASKCVKKVSKSLIV